MQNVSYLKVRQQNEGLSKQAVLKIRQKWQNMHKKKMLKISNHQKNADQNACELSPCCMWNGCREENNNNNNNQKQGEPVVGRLWRKGNPCVQ